MACQACSSAMNACDGLAQLSLQWRVRRGQHLTRRLCTLVWWPSITIEGETKPARATQLVRYRYCDDCTCTHWSWREDDRNRRSSPISAWCARCPAQWLKLPLLTRVQANDPVYSSACVMLWRPDTSRIGRTEHICAKAIASKFGVRSSLCENVRSRRHRDGRKARNCAILSYIVEGVCGQGM